MQETPKSCGRGYQSTRTPKILVRRKSLFSESKTPLKKENVNNREPLIELEQDLDGIGFLEDKDKSIEVIMQNGSFLKTSSPSDFTNSNSPQQNGSMETSSCSSTKIVPHQIDQELPILLNSMSLKKQKKKSFDEEEKENLVMSVKRAMKFSPRSQPVAKMKKLSDGEVSPIATSNFYSKTKYEPKPRHSPFIAKPTKLPRQKERAKKRASKGYLKPTSIEDILKTINSAKLKSKILAHREQKRKLEVVHEILMQTQNPIALAVPLNIDKNKDVSCNFSDVEEEYYLEDVDVELIDEVEDVEMEVQAQRSDIDSNEKDHSKSESVEEESVPGETRRKFFKSKERSNIKEVQIMGSIKAELMTGGKIALKEKIDIKQKPKRRRINKPSGCKFQEEQSAVESIIQNLDVTAEEPQPPQFIPFRDRIPYKTNDPETIQKQHILLDFLEANNICNEENFVIFIAEPENNANKAYEIMSEISDQIEVEDANEYRKRIPYNTTDPQVIEQQRTLLEFLISNGICNEENFNIFIVDYENRKDEAAEVMNQFITTEPVSSSPKIDVEAMDAVLPEADPEAVEEQQKFYSLFYREKAREAFKQLKFESSRKVRRFVGGLGPNQYQIDAGQKEFGATQCSSCGLIYSIHEPEEEHLHKEFHDNLYVLRFKGWINENVVSRFPEWSPDGRIIKLCSDDPLKRRQKVKEMFKIVVDKELGFSSYIFPQEYVAFLAISKNKIIGLCLVQPLEKAYKYLCIDGVDCCSSEAYDVRCGISRIWISPFYRRLKVGKSLISAVQSNTFLGKQLSMDEIAFSAPTEDGKQFARSVTHKDDFFVYQ